MKVLLVGPYAPDGQYSIPALVTTLANGLQKLGHSPTVCAPSATRLGRSLRPALGRRTAFVDKFLLFPRVLRRLAAEFDVVHIAEHGYSLYSDHLKNKPHLITCHDLIVAKAALGEISDWPLSGPARRYQMAIMAGLKHARHVSACSEATRKDVLRLCGRSESETSLVYNGFYRQFSRMGSAEARGVLKDREMPETEEWLLHVGGTQPNKNRKGVVAIFGKLSVAQPNLRLVLAGAPPEDAIKDEIAKLPDPGKVHLVPRPSDREIVALYSTARALIFPSLYEGYGLPIIEAQACGCPVVTSNRAPMTEVGGDAAVYVDPENHAAAASVILEGWGTLPALVSAGLENVRRFSSDAMCRSYADRYQQVV